MAEIVNNPELRFVEFKSKWVNINFGSLYSFKPTNSYSREKLNYETGLVKNIHYGDIHTKFNTLFDITKEKVPFINEDVDISRIAEENYVKEGDLVIADASEDYADIGKTIEIINLNDEKVLAGLHTFLARKEYEDLSTGFIGYLMKTYKVRLEIMRIAQGTKVLGIATSRLAKIPLHIPTKEEQQKITSFLKSIDNRIQLLEQKKEELEDYKKGIMQKIFNQDVRFKDENGENFPNWEETKLGDIGEFRTSSVDKKTVDGEEIVFLVNYMNVYRHETISNDNKSNLMRVSASETQIESSNLKKGDILFTPSSETPTDIGHSIVIYEDLDNTLYSYHLMRFRPSINLNLLYSHYFCNIPSVLKQLSKFATGSTRFVISVSSFAKVKIELPCVKEQQAIASFLNILDKTIVTTNNQIDDLIVYKHGLLQKMFV